MNAVLKKLNPVPGVGAFAANVPAALAPLVQELATVALVRADLAAAGPPLGFALVFATRQPDIDTWAPALAAHASGDVALWFAYPKQSSKNHRCEFNRDTGWAKLGALGFESVRQVALDDDWSALRFRRVEYVKTMRRHETRALTTTGKQKTAGAR